MEFILGNEQILNIMAERPGDTPFSDEIIEFCQIVSKELIKSPLGRQYPDITTLGFWLRKGSLAEIRKRFVDTSKVQIGRGLVFHVAPSNVPVNFAYSLFSGLLCGNTNVVRIPSKDFPQIPVIIDALKKGIDQYPDFAQRICLVRYGHDKEDNALLSSLCGVRVIWGGDNTIAEIRKSQLPPRATEITFADRYSLAVISSDTYSALDEKEKDILARSFYNDTYLTDQNACTSPRFVCFIKSSKDSDGTNQATDDVRNEFYSRLWNIVDREYVFQDIQGVNKLTKQYILAAVSEHEVINTGFEKFDNRLIRVEVKKPSISRELFDNSGYFVEYVTNDIMDIKEICDDNHCQTISYLGDSTLVQTVVKSGIRGVDRVVPIGKTMDFDFIWDGYNLFENLTRNISII